MATRVLDIFAMLEAAGVRPRGISADSRLVGPGDVFVAWPGAASDGRRYIDNALSRGASAVLYESADGFSVSGTGHPVFAVEGLRSLAGFMADEIYGRPSEKLWLTGVTGTNGKTTISQWIAHALSALGNRCGVIGTLGSGFPEALVAGMNTTPDAPMLHRLLAGFVADGAHAAAMEVSSIGLDQERVNGARFDIAIFSNLTRDHLDYHGSMQAYAEAKTRLFDLPGLAVAIINLDDDFGVELAKRQSSLGMRVIGYTVNERSGTSLPGVEVLAGSYPRASLTGQEFDLTWEGRRTSLDVRIAGVFNIANLLAVIGALLVHGLTLDDALSAAKTLTPPPGRMQLLGGVSDPLAIVDYAHTPDALIKVLESAREIARARSGQLICVFGCGGDRDHGKRPQMGEAANWLADRVIVTSDNPRNENPRKIIEDILTGTGSIAKAVTDRAEAIRFAIGTAKVNDVVVIAGKGHEPYQEIHGERRPFSDIEQVGLALAARGGRTKA